MVAQAQPQSAQVVRFFPHGASAELFKHHEPEVVVSGPAGTGKTYCALWRLHLCALKYPGMRGIMLRKVQEDLTASALVTYQERVLGAGKWAVRPFGGSKLKPAGFQYANGSELMIGGLDKADKVMSREYDLAYVNEATELTEEDWESLTTRMRWGRMPYQQVFGDCNPQGPGHWLYKRAHSDRTVMLFSKHEDNPALWDGTQWTEAGVAYIARLEGLSGFRRQRLLDGKWTAAEGAVYPMFDEQTHVREVDTTDWARVIGMDVGTSNPTAILTAYYAGDRIHIASEVYERGMSSDGITDAAVKAWGDGAEFIVVDPSSAGLILALQGRGLWVRKATNDVKIGIANVTSALPNLTIDPSCANLINEFQTYSYGKRADGDTPEKRFDHAMDALRYLVMELNTPITWPEIL